MSALTPAQAMNLALQEGRRGAGFVSPNPLVGCVILDSERRLIGQGYHARLGGDHAEIAALKSVKDREALRGAHVYVTLEPCAHQGRTPSCAKHLAELPIARVIYGIEDPNPQVAGKGAALLRAAGIECEEMTEFRSACRDLAEIFFVNMTEKRPFVAVKVAASLDGRIALKNGESRWITNEESRAFVHELRGEYDAVLTGTGTVLTDDPRLDSRQERFQDKPQKLIVLDPQGRLGGEWPRLKCFQARDPKNIIWVTGDSVNPGKAGVQHLPWPLINGRIPLSSLAQPLLERNIFSYLVEAGGDTVSGFLSERAVDRLYLFVAPRILGQGRSWTEGLHIETLDQSRDLTNLQIRSFGRDLLISARLVVQSLKSN